MRTRLIILVVWMCFAAPCHAQRLFWQTKEDQGSYRCAYGEIQVLATSPKTDFCGFTWWIQCPARGDMVIRDTGQRHTINFSVRDTTPEMPTIAVEQGNLASEINHGSGESAGVSTELPYHWEIGGTFRYFIMRRQDPDRKGNLTSSFYFDEAQGRWAFLSTFFSPDNGDKCIKGFGGTMAAAVDTLNAKDADTPRLAVFRLWVGTTLDDLTSVNAITGEGIFGSLNNSFFAASGKESDVKALVNGYDQGGGFPTYGSRDPLSIQGRPIPAEYLKSLRRFLQPAK